MNKKSIFKIILFPLPFILLIVLELFILPIDYFTFRTWEALQIHRFNQILPGKFYPNMKISKTEQGEAAHHTRFAKDKHVTWYTDRYGYRKRNTHHAPQIVIIGDSNTVGSTLTQEDTLAEVFQKMVQKEVYPLAPANMGKYLSDKRFVDQPARIVILQIIERNILPDRIRPPINRPKIRDTEKRTTSHPFIQKTAVIVDRFYKCNMLFYMRARINSLLQNKPSSYRGRDWAPGQPMFFHNGTKQNLPIPKDRIKKIVEVLKKYKDILAENNSHFIFMPLPNKKTIYWDYLQGGQRSIFLDQLIQAVKSAEINVIDLQPLYEKERQRNKKALLYHTDDSHWNKIGVKLAAKALTIHSQKLWSQKPGKIRSLYR